MKVVKFGGSSLASGEQIEKVFQIVMSDPERKVVVVSAPGKRFAEDEKVTDLLIECAELCLQDSNPQEKFNAVMSRYSSIAAELDLPHEVISEIHHDLSERLNGDRSKPDRFMDLVKASGEDNNAKLVAAYFRERGVEATYINPGKAGLLVSDEPGNAQVLPESYENLYALREIPGIIIFPGFFGYSKQGEVFTFSRSGSDITGSILS